MNEHHASVSADTVELTADVTKMASTLVDWTRARMIAADVERLPAESVPLDRAVGRRLVADLRSLIDVPHYASSAMDGWAVAGEPPWQLVRSPWLEAGQATPIVTGGLVPRGVHGILRSEHATERNAVPGRQLVRTGSADPDEPRAGQHIRPVAEEARAGELIFPVGELLSPAHIAVIAACGYNEVTVVRQPRVAIVNTGREVVDVGVPQPGSVRDSFGPQFPALVEMMGGRVVSQTHVDDDVDCLARALGFRADDTDHTDDTDEPDVIITTGGTGSSDVDFLHRALHRLNARVLIDGIAMRPGSPSVLARLPGGCVVVGLPGNPLAAMMGMLTLTQPLLDSLTGTPPRRLGADVLGAAVENRRGRTHLVPYSRVAGAAHPVGWNGSGMMRGLAIADGVLVIPPQGADVGQRVQTITLPWQQR